MLLVQRSLLTFHHKWVTYLSSVGKYWSRMRWSKDKHKLTRHRTRSKKRLCLDSGSMLLMAKVTPVFLASSKGPFQTVMQLMRVVVKLMMAISIWKSLLQVLQRWARLQAYFCILWRRRLWTPGRLPHHCCKFRWLGVQRVAVVWCHRSCW